MLPTVALLPLGMLWLWQNSAISFWLIAMVVCSAAGYGLQQGLLRRDRKLLASAATTADPHWPPKADAAWTAVE
ncbi:MAG: GTP-binding protein HSR1, partial [Synechococcaceae cyanobacterium SM1_2_3]|nr:GTP-binding protein HSR1 [Synechococcaceae cyanobacterium SM1_2_3]